MNKSRSVLKGFGSCFLILLQVSTVFSRRQPRIVGGTPTNITDAPFLVQVLLAGTYRCGGTLVSEQFVVSAAHCFLKESEDKFTIVGGTSKLSDNTGIRSEIGMILVSSSFNSYSLNADVAVVKLKRPLRRLVQPIALCKTDWKDGDAVQIYGWGSLGGDTRHIPDQVHTVEVNVVNKDVCQQLYHHRTLTDSMFCAGAPGKNSCVGDSGGPAIINGEFCGIVSWGHTCANNISLGVYTNVLNVAQFIQFAMKM